jgi:uncharacterized protein Yka (UPF0111/DUF47 family)
MDRGDHVKALMQRIQELEEERDTALARRQFTEQWYGVRLERLKDLAKEHGIWDQMACIVANGTASISEPPTYAQMLNMAQHKAERLEKERDHWKANHANQVRRARVLLERHDLPLERVAAYDHVLRLQNALKRAVSLLDEANYGMSYAREFEAILEGKLTQFNWLKEQD